MQKPIKADIKIHPAADIFPMLDSEELAGLAESIAKNGQRFPIMLWKDSKGEVLLIDGRNRRKACELADVEPWIDYFEGDENDVLAYIADVNLARRDLKKAQKIMALAMLYPDTGKRGRGNKLDDEILKKLKILAKSLNSAQVRLSQARKVLVEYPDLAQKVLIGSLGLDEAITQAKKKNLESKTEAEQMATLREKAPKLADGVPDQMTLAMAWAAYQQQLDDEAEMIKGLCDGHYRGIVGTARSLWGYGTGVETKDDFYNYVLENDEFLQRIDALGGLMWEHVDPEVFRAGTEHLIQLLNDIKEKKYGKADPTA